MFQHAKKLAFQTPGCISIAVVLAQFRQGFFSDTHGWAVWEAKFFYLRDEESDDAPKEKTLVYLLQYHSLAHQNIWLMRSRGFQFCLKFFWFAITWWSFCVWESQEERCFLKGFGTGKDLPDSWMVAGCPIIGGTAVLGDLSSSLLRRFV